MRTKIIFFDWDGTLASTKISEEANIARTKVICEDFDKNELLKLQRNNGDNHYAFIQKVLREETGIEDFDEIKRIQVYLFTFFYLKFFRKNPYNYLIADLQKLKALKKKYNLKLIVITGLFKEIIGGCLRAIDPKKEIFDDYFGIESNIEGKKVDFISRAIEKYPDCEPFAMIGDKEDDISPGKYHNIKTIFCDYGHGKSNGADAVALNPDEMIDAIERLLISN